MCLFGSQALQASQLFQVEARADETATAHASHVEQIARLQVDIIHEQILKVASLAIECNIVQYSRAAWVHAGSKWGGEHPGYCMSLPHALSGLVAL